MQIEQGSNLPKIKLSNQASILRMIYYHAPITRIEIAESLGLTLPTITANVNTMIASGIVQEIGIPEDASSSLGRKPRLLDIVSNSRYFLGVEMRGTRRRVCVTDYCGNVIKQLKDDRPYRTYSTNMKATCSLIRHMLEDCAKESLTISGIGFAVPGLVDSENGILKIHPAYNWQEKDIVSDVSRLTGYEGPIYVENNACARAYSAQLFRHSFLNNVPSFAYLFVSDGIASPLVINTSSYSGSFVGEGEIGHMIMNPKGPRCSCGNHGCLEAYSSDRAIISHCTRLIRNQKAPVLKEICEGSSVPDISQILKAQKMGEESICKVLTDAVTTLGIAIANIDNFARPHTILIEGLLFKAEKNRSLLLETINRNLYASLGKYGGSKFIFIEADDFSGAWGGAAVAICKNLETIQ